MAPGIIPVPLLLLLALLLALTAAAAERAPSRSPPPAAAGGIGVNWGTMMSHPLVPKDVVRMLLSNGISRVKLFDADPWTVSAFAGTGIELMLGIPNDQLRRMSRYRKAKSWVRKNVTSYGESIRGVGFRFHVNIKYVAVGNEPFLKSYNDSFTNLTIPALRNIQRALDEAGVGNRIKATVPLNADVYYSPPSNPVPSAGTFRADIAGVMVQLIRHLRSHNSPFLVNIYPFLSLYQNEGFPPDYAFFDGRFDRPLADAAAGVNYTNVFDANYDTLVWALRSVGVPDVPIVVGEVGWPTDGDRWGNVTMARRFYDGFLRKLASSTDAGTPMRPRDRIRAYMFALFDEDRKSVAPGNFERHWGIFGYDGRPKFPMDIAGKGRQGAWLKPVRGVQYLPKKWCVLNDRALGELLQGSADDIESKLKRLPLSVSYACSLSDCTSLGYGSSCNALSEQENVSYAFNMYFQVQDQDVRACDFGGLAKITDRNASKDGCLFPIMIASGAEDAMRAGTRALLAVLLLVASFVLSGGSSTASSFISTVRSS